MFYKLCLVAAFALFSLNAQAAQEAAAEAGGERVENDYYNCLQAASGYSDDEKAICMSGEIKRLDRAISDLYQKTFLKVERIQKWNNGNGMFRGNIKDMQDQFNGYRSRFCSFYATTMQIYSGSQMYLMTPTSTNRFLRPQTDGFRRGGKGQNTNRRSGSRFVLRIPRLFPSA